MFYCYSREKHFHINTGFALFVLRSPVMAAKSKYDTKDNLLCVFGFNFINNHLKTEV